MRKTEPNSRDCATNRPLAFLAWSRCTTRNPVLLVCLALVAVLGGCAPVSFLITPVTRERGLEEFEVVRESIWADKKIALLDVDGVLRNVRERTFVGPAGENPVALFAEKLEKAAKDERVKALVLRVNSPGGGVTATDLMYTELQRFKRKTGKPVIAALLDGAASGGYYVACAADTIYAHPTSVTGSIGVVMVAPEFSGTMDKLGIRANVIKSGELKDAGSMFREMTDEERAVFQRIIDAMYARFLDVVAAGRPGLARERLERLADGRVYLAAEAKEHGLIDELGTLHDALGAAKKAAGLDGKPVVVVEYARPLSHRPNVYAQSPETPAQVNLINLELPAWLEGPSPNFMYIWAPGW